MQSSLRVPRTLEQPLFFFFFCPSFFLCSSHFCPLTSFFLSKSRCKVCVWVCNFKPPWPLTFQMCAPHCWILLPLERQAASDYMRGGGKKNTFECETSEDWQTFLIMSIEDAGPLKSAKLFPQSFLNLFQTMPKPDLWIWCTYQTGSPVKVHFALDVNLLCK